MTINTEATLIAERRPDAVQHVLREQAARHHRLASFITENDLPDAAVTVQKNGTIVSVSATHCDLPENVVRRWAQALELIVTENPYDWNGTAATTYQASGCRDGVYYLVSAIIPVAVTA